MNKLLIRVFGFYATIMFGDSAVIDRWFWLRRNLKSGNLRTLDAGCGSGAFSLYAAQKGNDVLGISFDEENNKKATERAQILGLSGARFITADLRKLDEEAKSLGLFDQIICFETIEHILGDKKLIHDFSSILIKGGRLLLTAPYKFYKPLVGDKLSEIEDGGHVRWGYTHEEFAAMMTANGLRVVKKDYITGVISQYVVQAIRIVGAMIPPKIAWVITLPLRLFVIFDRPVTALLRYPHLSVGIVAEKI